MYAPPKKTFVAIITDGFAPSSRGREGRFLPLAFTDFLGTGKTLLQQTFERFCSFIPIGQILVVTGPAHRADALAQLPLLDAAQVLAVPAGASACLHAQLAFSLAPHGPHTALILAPAGHLVLQHHAFEHVCSHALGIVHRKGGGVTLGVQPTHTNPCYPYIRRSAKDVEEGVFRAEHYLAHTRAAQPLLVQQEDRYLWHTGIFAWKVADLLSALNRLMPDLFRSFEQAASGPASPERFQQAYAAHPAAVLDWDSLCRKEKIYVIPASFGWSDIGTWYEPRLDVATR